jgi:hypothetical protein
MLGSMLLLTEAHVVHSSASLAWAMIPAQLIGPVSKRSSTKSFPFWTPVCHVAMHLGGLHL